MGCIAMKIKPILCAFGCLFPAALLGKLGDRTGIFCKDGLKLTSCAEVFVYPKAGHHSSIPCFKNLTPLMGPFRFSSSSQASSPRWPCMALSSKQITKSWPCMSAMNSEADMALVPTPWGGRTSRLEAEKTRLVKVALVFFNIIPRMEYYQ